MVMVSKSGHRRWVLSPKGCGHPASHPPLTVVDGCCCQLVEVVGRRYNALKGDYRYEFGKRNNSSIGWLWRCGSGSGRLFFMPYAVVSSLGVTVSFQWFYSLVAIAMTRFLLFGVARRWRLRIGAGGALASSGSTTNACTVGEGGCGSVAAGGVGGG
ncbi:hypothetical protein CRG98_035581 [Punica granatum]|uniref:Uncharacterized protein n=1 Tax=Punica granatum TaxID=22663 RepID=A0A2I0IKW3_PUNGR|nr:hypothetical protein CRG98_035581 [Punica granatum]